MPTQFDPARASDAQLLTRFEDGRDQVAFAELVRRHGPMVMATARRVLASRADAEEAFQATLFTLAKASGKLRQKAAVAGWLHKTAYSCAAQIRRQNARRQKVTERVKEHALASTRDAQPVTTADPSVTVAHAELKEILDQELAKLPQDLRAAIVLCDLEGLTQKQAARQLGIPPSTVNHRAAKARRMLRTRLIRRGVSLTVAGLASCVASSSVASTGITEGLITELTTKATLFAAGNSAAQIGVSTTTISTARKVISAMTTAKITAVCLCSLAIVAFMGPAATVIGIRLNTGSAMPIHHWRFEDNPGFLVDSIGNATLTPQNVVQVPLPSNGQGTSFPGRFQGIGMNASASHCVQSIAALKAANTITVEDAFTIEMFFSIDDLSRTNIGFAMALLAAQATSPGDMEQFGWALTIDRDAGTFPEFTPQPRELQLRTSDGARFQIIESGIFIEENTHYYLAVSFDASSDVRFFVKELDTGLVQDIAVPHSVPRLNPDPFMQIGGPYDWGFVDGIIDEVRLSRGVLPVDQLLINLTAPVPESATASVLLTIVASTFAGAVWHRRFR